MISLWDFIFPTRGSLDTRANQLSFLCLLAIAQFSQFWERNESYFTLKHTKFWVSQTYYRFLPYWVSHSLCVPFCVYVCASVFNGNCLLLLLPIYSLSCEEKTCIHATLQNINLILSNVSLYNLNMEKLNFMFPYRSKDPLMFHSTQYPSRMLCRNLIFLSYLW